MDKILIHYQWKKNWLPWLTCSNSCLICTNCSNVKLAKLICSGLFVPSLDDIINLLFITADFRKFAKFVTNVFFSKNFIFYFNLLEISCVQMKKKNDDKLPEVILIWQCRSIRQCHNELSMFGTICAELYVRHCGQNLFFWRFIDWDILEYFTLKNCALFLYLMREVFACSNATLPYLKQNEPYI